MDIYVLIEYVYLSSSWCKNIINGLNVEKKLKKIKIQFINALEEIYEPSKFSSVILIGTKNSWIEKNIYEVKNLNLNPILISTTVKSSCIACSVVSSDIIGAVSEAFLICRQNNMNKVALYGVNPESITDSVRKNAFLSIGGKKNDVYYNNGLLKGCFYSFLPNLQKYNSVICVNDFTAISLIKRLNKEALSNKNISIISLSNSALGEIFSPKITSFTINHEKFGSAAIMIHKELSKNKFVSSLNALIKYDLVSGETTPKYESSKQITPIISTENKSDVNIYKDIELLEMMSVENFLKTADDSDWEILKFIKENRNREFISDNTFLSHSAIKYRVKNHCKNFKVNNINRVVEILEKYLIL